MYSGSLPSGSKDIGDMSEVIGRITYRNVNEKRTELDKYHNKVKPWQVKKRLRSNSVAPSWELMRDG